MSSLEYAHWEAFALHEPLGVERGDYHAAQIVSTLAEINRDRKSRLKPYGLQDFLLFHDRPDPTDEDVEQQLLAVFPMTPGDD